jgi:AraC family transcriptional regulator, ethanolamine operon transcriptional activator
MLTATMPLGATSTRLHAFDPQALVLALQEGFLEHVQLQKGRFGGQIAHSVSRRCRTDWGQYNLALMARGDLSPEWLSVGIFLHGEGTWHVQGQRMRNGDIAIYAAGSEMCISLPPNAQWLSVQVPSERLEYLGLRLAPGTTNLHLPGQLEPEARQTLSDLAAVLGPQRPHHPSPAQLEMAHEQLLQIIWGELARRWRHPSASEVVTQKTRQRLVESVHRWCDDRSASPLRLDTLCQEMEIPIWQLERAFHQTYGMPPQRLLTLHRLAKARRELLRQNSGVTEVAMEHGFWHLGRFSLLYRDYFGENPSDTVRAGRSVGLAGSLA